MTFTFKIFALKRPKFGLFKTYYQVLRLSNFKPNYNFKFNETKNRIHISYFAV